MSVISVVAEWGLNRMCKARYRGPSVAVGRGTLWIVPYIYPIQ